jgi:cytochrome c biogenesis protein CcmG/thiol:disulfide interchange protein DsbE
MNRVFRNAFAHALAALLISLLSLAGAQRVGEAAPDFRLVDAEGRLVRLADFRGRPVVLNFWATWCPPCLEELPLFQELSESLNTPGDEANVVFLLLNNNENPELARGFLEAEGIRLRAVLEPDEAQREAYGDLGRTLSVLRDYRVRGMPTTFFIDADGIIRGIKQGLISPGEASELLATIGLDWQP